MFGKSKSNEKNQAPVFRMTERQSELASSQIAKLVNGFYSVDASARPRIAAIEIGKLLPLFVMYASEFRHDAYMPAKVSALTEDDIASMSDDELKRLHDRCQLSQTETRRFIEIVDCVECLESVEGWETADSVADEMRIVIAAYEESKAVIGANRHKLQAEISRRDAIAYEEARRHRYIEENQVEIIQALLSGGDTGEFLQLLENPPKPDNGGAALAVNVLNGLSMPNDDE